MQGRQWRGGPSVILGAVEVPGRRGAAVPLPTGQGAWKGPSRHHQRGSAPSEESGGRCLPAAMTFVPGVGSWKCG